MTVILNANTQNDENLINDCTLTTMNDYFDSVYNYNETEIDKMSLWLQNEKKKEGHDYEFKSCPVVNQSQLNNCKIL